MEQYLPLIYGPAGALVVLAIWVWAQATGKIHSDREFTAMATERDYWKDAYNKQAETTQIERRIVNQTVEAGQVNNQLLTALVNLAGERRAVPAPVPAAENPGP